MILTKYTPLDLNMFLLKIVILYMESYLYIMF